MAKSRIPIPVSSGSAYLRKLSRSELRPVLERTRREANGCQSSRNQHDLDLLNPLSTSKKSSISEQGRSESLKMVEPKEDFEEMPNSGWGVSYNGFVKGTDGILIWDEDDIELVDFADQEKAAFNDKKESRKIPNRLRAYGLWNVSKAQLLDPTWTPIPYRMLDDACMLFVMILCPRVSARARYWPFNFDSTGKPRQTRQQIGYGVHCQYGSRENIPSSSKHVHGTSLVRTGIESFLVWKRHHIFAGTEASGLTVTEGNKDTRMKLGTSDPSVWSYGTQIAPVNLHRIVDGRNFCLRFYFTESITGSPERAFERAKVNLDGYWFEIMRRTDILPFLLGLKRQPQLSDQTPSTSAQVLTSQIPDDLAYLTRSQSRIKAKSSDASVNGLFAIPRRKVIDRRENSSRRLRVMDGGFSSIKQLDHPYITFNDDDEALNPPSLASHQTVVRTESLPSKSINPPLRLSTASSSVNKELSKTSRKRPRRNTSEVEKGQLGDHESPNFDEIGKAQHDAKSVVDFFLNFDANSPEADHGVSDPLAAKNELKTPIINSIIAPWKTELIKPSAVEVQQAQAIESYGHITSELQAMVNDLAAIEALALAKRKAINTKVDTFLLQLSRQPVHTALHSVKESVLSLIAAGHIPSARYVAHAIRSRLQREPILEYHFDIDESNPKLRSLLCSNDTQAKVGSSISRTPDDAWSEGTDDDCSFEALPDIMHL